MRGELLQTEVDVEAQCGYVVDDVDRWFDELAFPRAGYEADEYLEGEPGVADALDVEKRDVGVRVGFVDGPAGSVRGGFHSDVFDNGDPHVRVGLEAEGQYRDADEEYGYDANYLEKESYYYSIGRNGCEVVDPISGDVGSIDEVISDKFPTNDGVLFSRGTMDVK